MEYTGRFLESLLIDSRQELLRIKRLLAALEGCTGISSPSYREKVQGGDSTPAALRYTEIIDALDRCSPVLIEIVKTFDRQTDKKKTVYTRCILDGESDMSSRGITPAQRKALRVWLAGIVEKVEKTA